MAAVRLIIERMRRRSATTGFMVEASLKVHETVGVLSLPVEGARHAEEAEIRGKMASCKTRAASSRSEFVMRPCGLRRLTRSLDMSSGHRRRQT